MHLSPEEQRLIRMFRALDSFARNTYMTTLGKEMMERYAVNIGVTLCESDRLAQQRVELSDEMRHRYEERLWAAHPPLLVKTEDRADSLVPHLAALPLVEIMFGYPWDSTDAEIAEFLADHLFAPEASASEVALIGRWLEEWREKVFTSFDIQIDS